MGNIINQIAEVQVIYTSPITIANRKRIHSSQDAYSVFMDSWDMDTFDLQEAFNVLLLNRANEVLGIYRLSRGGLSGTLVDPRLIFSVALKGMASSVILAHNHPSGNLKPSKADIDLTNKLKDGGELLDIPILDHLIVTRNGYYSLADNGGF